MGARKNTLLQSNIMWVVYYYYCIGEVTNKMVRIGIVYYTDLQISYLLCLRILFINLLKNMFYAHFTLLCLFQFKLFLTSRDIILVKNSLPKQ